MSVLNFNDVDIPEGERDATPPSDDGASSGDFNPEFPGSTPEAPYGYKADGTPYKRRPNNSVGAPKSTGRVGAASDKSARAAASLLAQANNLVGISLMAFGMPQTAASLAEANEKFESMAVEALRTDPVLCKKILGAGSMSGRTALFMAYGYLAMAAFPSAKDEFIAKRNERMIEDGSEEY